MYCDVLLIPREAVRMRRKSFPPSRPGWVPRQALTGCLLLAMTLGACASGATRRAYSPLELKTLLATAVPPDRLSELVVPHQVTEEMVGRAREYTQGRATDRAKANRLVDAITNVSEFGLEWDRIATTPADETLATGHGNCLSLTAVFVGLARGLGLTAFYVDASDRINRIERGDDLLVRTGHIIATVRTERGWSMVDFTGEISSYRTFQVINDREALAHFYNNRGYEGIATAQALGDEIRWDLALKDFSLATMVGTEFARAHNNLGVAYARLGDDDAARRGYMAAIAADASFAEPRQNLGNLSVRNRDYAAALNWYEIAIGMQPKNPYLRYYYGLAQYQSGDIEASVESFKRAIALKQDFLEPRTLLAQAYRQLGMLEEAEEVVRAKAKQRRLAGSD